MNKKWQDPIDKLLAADYKASRIDPAINSNHSSIFANEDHIVSLNPQQVILWKYKDRPENELGDIDLLAKKLLEFGQQQPCIVRPIKNKPEYYELIAGERRWRAALSANIDLKVIIKDLNDQESSIIQEEENFSNPLSEYAKGINYAAQINDGIITQSDLTEKLGISKQKLSRLLSYSQIPIDVINAIGDMQKVSSGTAEKIKQLCNKGDQYKNCIIKLSEKIRLGKIGHEKLRQLVETSLIKKTKIPPEKFCNANGELLCIMNVSNTNITFTIRKEFIQNLKKNKEDQQLFAKKIIEVLEMHSEY